MFRNVMCTSVREEGKNDRYVKNDRYDHVRNPESKTRPIYDCRCDEGILKPKDDEST